MVSEVKVGLVRERRQGACARVCIHDEKVNRIGTYVEHPKSHTSTLLTPGRAGPAGPAKGAEVALAPVPSQLGLG